MAFTFFPASIFNTLLDGARHLTPAIGALGAGWQVLGLIGLAIIALNYAFFAPKDKPRLTRLAIAVGMAVAFVPITLWVIFSQVTGRGGALPFTFAATPKYAQNLFIDFRADKTDADLFDERVAIAEMDRHGDAGNWTAIHEMIRRNDQDGFATPTGYPINEALTDHLFAPFDEMRDAAYENGFDINLDTLDSYVQPYEDRLTEAPGDHIAAALCARAHIGAGWAARGECSFDQIKPKNVEAFLKHFEQADRILRAYPAQSYQSPLLAQLDYELCIGSPKGHEDIRAKFAILQQLAPRNPRIYSRHGFRLLPRWFGDYEELETTARALIDETEPFFGKAAYALTYLTALEYDEEAQKTVDPNLFIEGVDDFVTFTGTQMAVNLMGHRLVTIKQMADSGALRSAINSYLPSLLKEDLAYVLPTVWEMEATSIKGLLSLLWMDVLEAGKEVHYTSHGVEIRTPAPA